MPTQNSLCFKATIFWLIRNANYSVLKRIIIQINVNYPSRIVILTFSSSAIMSKNIVSFDRHGLISFCLVQIYPLFLLLVHDIWWGKYPWIHTLLGVFHEKDYVFLKTIRLEQKSIGFTEAETQLIIKLQGKIQYDKVKASNLHQRQGVKDFCAYKNNQNDVMAPLGNCPKKLHS